MPSGSLALRLLVTAGLLGALLFAVTDPREVWAFIAGAAPIPFSAAVLLSLGDRFLMAYKWWLLLVTRDIPVSLWTAVRCYLASSLYGLVLPVTVGADAVRILALRQFGVAEVAASIVIERGLGVIAMGSVSLFSCLLLATTVAQFTVQSLSLWLTIAIMLSLALFVASLHLADRWANSRRSSTSHRFLKAIEAYGQYRRRPRVLTVFYTLSVGESLLSAVIAYVVAISLGVPAPLFVFVATVPLALASARLPISLGGFGVQEASFVFLAGLVGMPSAQALSIMLMTDIAMLLALLPSAFDSSMLTLRREAVAQPPNAESRVL